MNEKNVQAPVDAEQHLSNEAYIEGFNAVMRGRVEKMEALRAEGIEVYVSGYSPTHRAQALKNEFGEKTHDELEALGVKCKIAGRIMAMRVFGKGSFASIKDTTGLIQIHVGRDNIGEESYARYKKYDMGDIIGAEGELFVTKTGELTVRCSKVELLTKSLRPLPEKWHGLTDTEQRYRQRYVDLMVNDEVKEVFMVRSRVTNALREFMTQANFIEVETPMMHMQAGGAAARPFKTRHNALDIDMYLRVAPELYLKRLIVGGFERVFELNRNFRNEGLSRRHNPEFTMMEFYMAYATYTDLMDYIESLVQSISLKVIGTTSLRWNGNDIELSGKWRRLRIREGVAEALKVEELQLSDRAFLEAAAAKLPQPLSAERIATASDGQLLMELFDQRVEASLIQPTFVYEYPSSVSPLARRNDADPNYVDRFEIFMGGIELGNAFNELNDPLDQRQRFLEQLQNRLDGDDEAHPMDDDYVRALEYGMPPCAGAGIGVDRLVMMLTGADSIRDVILFPAMRPDV